MPPRDIQESMEKQMRAERERRESILQAEGQKQSQILVAEGEKQSAILRADAAKQAAILQAEGAKQAKILEAEAEAEAILKVQQATADAIRLINDAAPGDGVIKIKALEAFQAAAQRESHQDHHSQRDSGLGRSGCRRQDSLRHRGPQGYHHQNSSQRVSNGHDLHSAQKTDRNRPLRGLFLFCYIF